MLSTQLRQHKRCGQVVLYCRIGLRRMFQFEQNGVATNGTHCPKCKKRLTLRNTIKIGD